MKSLPTQMSSLFLALIFSNLLSARYVLAELKPCPIEAPNVALPELQEFKSKDFSNDLAKKGAQLICDTQFAKRKSCPQIMIESLLQIVSLTQDSLKPASPVNLDKIVEGQKGPEQISYATQVVRGNDNAIYLQIGRHITESGTGSFKVAVLVFRLAANKWTPAIFLTLKDSSSVGNEQGRKRWNRELEVSRLILQRRLANPALSQGLPLIYWVSEDGIYQKHYDGSLYELFNSSAWANFRHSERMEAMRQAALALKNFHLLEDGNIVHEDVKMDNYLYSLEFLLSGDQCIEVVLSDLDLSLNAALLIQEGRLRPNSGSLLYFDPSKIFQADGFAGWKPFEYEPRPQTNASQNGSQWLGDTTAQQVAYAQRGDLYSLGLTFAVGVFGVHDDFWAATLSSNNNAPSKHHSPLIRAQDIQEWIDDYLDDKKYGNLEELLRTALDNDPRKRISSSQFYESLEYALSPILPIDEKEAQAKELISPLCSGIKQFTNEMQVGEFSICRRKKNKSYKLIYKLPSQGGVARVSEKNFSENMDWSSIQHEVQFLRLLGVIQTEFQPQSLMAE
ncbi:MAG: hypothetical protein HYX41_01875 [Bdellovibrio sp.]|nr:hypothetical protein [Bdellovibrio sp.]